MSDNWFPVFPFFYFVFASVYIFDWFSPFYQKSEVKPGFHYPSWRPELTARVDGWPVSITRRVDGRAFPLAELTGRDSHCTSTFQCIGPHVWSWTQVWLWEYSEICVALFWKSWLIYYLTQTVNGYSSCRSSVVDKSFYEHVRLFVWETNRMIKD